MTKGESAWHQVKI